MEHKHLSIEANVSDREFKMIISTLAKYNIDLKKVTKSRSVYKIIDSEDKTYCLKKIKHGAGKARNGDVLVNILTENGFTNTSKYLRTQEGEISVKYDKFILYLTEWIDGEECNMSTLEEAVNCAALLANFHKAARNIDFSKLKVKNNLKNLPKIFYRNLSNFERFDNLIQKKRIRNEFDVVYSRYIETFYSRGLTALNILNNSNYYLLSREASVSRTLCHDSFYYQNIIKKDGNYYIIDLDSIIIDLQVSDLGKFIRRLMFKTSFQWNFDKAKYIIEAYNSVKPLSREELEVMLALIIFPHKFWKLGKKRYIKQKGWSEKKYMNKLFRLIRYNEAQQSFLEKYMNYFNITVPGA